MSRGALSESWRNKCHKRPGATKPHPHAWPSETPAASDHAFPGPVAAAPPADSDGDGVPDAWEHARGLNPSKPDGASIGLARGCAAGYSALECYINELADALVPR
jgi:hypothetical protein